MRASRLLAGIGILLVTGILAFVATSGGAFSCYDCIERPLQPIYEGVAVVILIIGVVVAARVAFGGRRPKGPAGGPPPGDGASGN